MLCAYACVLYFTCECRTLHVSGVCTRDLYEKSSQTQSTPDVVAFSDMVWNLPRTKQPLLVLHCLAQYLACNHTTSISHYNLPLQSLSFWLALTSPLHPSNSSRMQHWREVGVRLSVQIVGIWSVCVFHLTHLASVVISSHPHSSSISPCIFPTPAHS